MSDAIMTTASHYIRQGCEYIFQDTRQTGKQFSIFTRQVRKLAKNIERVSQLVSEMEKKNSPNWRVGFYFYCISTHQS
jgi:hypothetical protein